MNPPMPDGWRLLGYCHTAEGCLEINLDYRDEVSYVVTWHTSNYVTMRGREPSGARMAFDPTVVALAMFIAAEKCLDPNYSLRSWHPREVTVPDNTWSLPPAAPTGEETDTVEVLCCHAWIPYPDADSPTQCPECGTTFTLAEME